MCYETSEEEERRREIEVEKKSANRIRSRRERGLRSESLLLLPLFSSLKKREAERLDDEE